MSNEAELCARALARFIHDARVRGVEIRRAGILTGEAKRTQVWQQIQTGRGVARNSNEPERGGSRTNPSNVDCAGFGRR
jgi:hypothetical protein